MSQQDEIRQRINSKIIEALKAGTAPWRRPWTDVENTGFPTNIISKRRYSGVNPLLLDLVAKERTFQSKWWGTFNQIQSLGGMVKKRPADVPPGFWGTKIVFVKPLVKIVTTKDGEEEKTKFFVMREYVVFNIDQCEGSALDQFRVRARSGSNFVDYDPAQQVIEAAKADIRHGGNRAFYSRHDDFIQMPAKNSFLSATDYYATAFHELCHWSECRLNWTGSYALGELVAEIGGCYLSTEVGIPQSADLSNHTAYLASWLEALSNDPKAIFKAATQASKAADFILAFSGKAETGDWELVEAGAG